MLDQPQSFFRESLTVCVTAKVFYSKTFALYGIHLRYQQFFEGQKKSANTTRETACEKCCWANR